jgi:hypothetical protein
MVGCSVGQGRGEIKGSLYISECKKDLSKLDLGIDFFGAEVQGKGLYIRLQRGGDYIQFSDGVMIQVYNYKEIAKRLNEVIKVVSDIPEEIGKKNLPPWLIRISLFLNNTCPTSFPSLSGGKSIEESEKEGYIKNNWIRFESIYCPDCKNELRYNNKIKGDFRVNIFDPRVAEIKVYGWIEGYFDFVYRRGRPAQRFP